jgi:hypothetical protein
LYDQARSIEPRLRQHGSDHALGSFLKDQGCDNKKKVLRRTGWSFPPFGEARKAWEERFPGWLWHDPDLTDWYFEGSKLRDSGENDDF